MLILTLLTSQSEAAPEKSHINELICAIARDDAVSFEALYRLTQSSVFGFALSITKDRHDAEDVMQQTYINVYSAAPEFKPHGNGLTWILSIAKNNALMLLRQKRRETAIDPEAITDDHIILFPATASDTDRRLLLEAALQILTDTERQIIILHAVTGLKHREIAGLLDLPLATVLSKYTRGLAKLRDHIGQEM